MFQKRSFYLLNTKHFTLSSGFTLAELMIIVALIAILIIGALIGWQKQIDRGYDAKRKGDLKNIQNAFDDYYNDKNCYPPVEVLSNCSSTDLSPYIAEIPCDPHTHQPYKYRPLSVDGGETCSGYRVLTTLKDKEDADIKRVGCNAEWCGFDDAIGYNYGVSMGVQVPKDGFVLASVPPTPTPIPPPVGNPNFPLACAPNHTCDNFGTPNTCPITFEISDGINCGTYCHDPTALVCTN